MPCGWLVGRMSHPYPLLLVRLDQTLDENVGQAIVHQCRGYKCGGKMNEGRTTRGAVGRGGGEAGGVMAGESEPVCLWLIDQWSFVFRLCGEGVSPFDRIVVFRRTTLVPCCRFEGPGSGTRELSETNATRCDQTTQTCDASHSSASHPVRALSLSPSLSPQPLPGHRRCQASFFFSSFL